MSDTQAQQPVAELRDEALDEARGGNLGDTATHEVGHVRRRIGDGSVKSVIGGTDDGSSI